MNSTFILKGVFFPSFKSYMLSFKIIPHHHNILYCCCHANGELEGVIRFGNTTTFGVYFLNAEWAKWSTSLYKSHQTAFNLLSSHCNLRLFYLPLHANVSNMHMDNTSQWGKGGVHRSDEVILQCDTVPNLAFVAASGKQAYQCLKHTEVKHLLLISATVAAKVRRQRLLSSIAVI